MSSETKDDRKNPFGAPSPWGSAYRGTVPLTPPPSSNFGQRALARGAGAPLTPPPASPTAESPPAPRHAARSSILSGSALPIGWATPAVKHNTPSPAPEPVAEPVLEQAPPSAPIASDPVFAEPPRVTAAEADALLFDEPALRATPFEAEAPSAETPVARRESVALAAPKPVRTPEPAESATLSFAAPPARRRRKSRTGAVALVLGGGAAAAAAIALVVVMSERASETGAKTPASIDAAASPGAPATAFPAEPAPEAAMAVATPPAEPAPERLSVQPRPTPSAPAVPRRQVAEARPEPAPTLAVPAARAPVRINVAPTPLKPPPVQAAPAEPPPAPDILFDAETPITTNKPSN